MNKNNELRNALQRIIKTDDRPYSVIGTVISIDEDSKTCDVQLLNSEIVFFDVLFSADSDSSFVQYPLKNSKVIISFLAYNKAFISQNSVVEKFDFTSSAGENLKEIMIDYVSEMYDNISMMTLNHPQAPTSPKPINDHMFSKTKSDFIDRIKKIFK